MESVDLRAGTPAPQRTIGKADEARGWVVTMKPQEWMALWIAVVSAQPARASPDGGVPDGGEAARRDGGEAEVGAGRSWGGDRSLRQSEAPPRLRRGVPAGARRLRAAASRRPLGRAPSVAARPVRRPAARLGQGEGRTPTERYSGGAAKTTPPRI